MLKRLYEWTLDKAGHRHAERWLAGLSFAESSFFPIPPDAMLLPMCLAQPARAFRYAAICTIASILGAMLGYAIGYFLFETVGEPILRFYGLSAEFSSFAERFNEQGWIIVLIAGFTPLPYKVITIAAGATAMPLHILIFASVIARSARFFLVAALLWKFGEPMKRIIDRHFGLITTAVAIAGIGGFVAVRYLF
ncbi:YqaA family protein [Parasphingopyxis marina]|uniref:DedA family protein n=1 Tax=Parasphingopyxis marina TaxID=2761622 RepID=A0A842I0V7_9SPHN|nr:YqaA family protein [Parasphingopyxis marina]MBC2778341.1 DedA family protein [Parasphingopyxis marina]